MPIPARLTPRVRRHRLHPQPASYEEAEQRLADLDREIARCRAQLSDPARPSVFRTVGLYDEWKGKAERALGLFLQEAELTRWWADADLAKQCAALLRGLEGDGEFEFEAEELPLVERMKSRFGSKEQGEKVRTA